MKTEINRALSPCHVGIFITNFFIRIVKRFFSRKEDMSERDQLLAHLLYTGKEKEYFMLWPEKGYVCYLPV